jgi:hypothetical protein
MKEIDVLSSMLRLSTAPLGTRLGPIENGGKW